MRLAHVPAIPLGPSDLRSEPVPAHAERGWREAVDRPDLARPGEVARGPGLLPLVAVDAGRVIPHG